MSSPKDNSPRSSRAVSGRGLDDNLTNYIRFQMGALSA